MSRRVALVTGLIGLVGAATSAAAGPTVDPVTRTLITGPFVVRWSVTDPEAIVRLSWNGSPNLTNSWVHPECPEGDLHEFFGNSWGGDGDAAFRAPVGWGSIGTWTQHGTSGVDIQSSTTACAGTSGIDVHTSYAFSQANGGRIQIERRFDFGSSPFSEDLRPYVARLYPNISYTQILHPNLAGTALLSRNAFDCGLGCLVPNWNGTWFAVHDPTAKRGLIVRHEPSSLAATLWVDEDGGSGTTAASVALLQPGIGFTGSVVEREILCFYDSQTWTPGLALPIGCSGGWTDVPATSLSRVGLAATVAAYGSATTVASLGRYVTWQGSFDSAAAGRTIGVLVATRNANGTWTPFSRVTSRIANAFGVVTYSRREAIAKWISVRFSLDATTSTASQARWR